MNEETRFILGFSYCILEVLSKITNVKFALRHEDRFLKTQVFFFMILIKSFQFPHPFLELHFFFYDKLCPLNLGLKIYI
jgi:hypothetical protein